MASWCHPSLLNPIASKTADPLNLEPAPPLHAPAMLRCWKQTKTNLCWGTFWRQTTTVQWRNQRYNLKQTYWRNMKWWESSWREGISSIFFRHFLSSHVFRKSLATADPRMSDASSATNSKVLHQATRKMQPRPRLESHSWAQADSKLWEWWNHMANYCGQVGLAGVPILPIGSQIIHCSTMLW